MDSYIKGSITVATVPRFKDVHLQAVCDVIGDTSAGLSGSEIGRCLSACSIIDPCPGITKRDRLFAALRNKQDLDSCANGVLVFIQHVMDPVRYVDQKQDFDSRRSSLNVVLAFCGQVLGEDGKLRRSSTAATISEAEAAANILRRALVERRVHADVLRFCRAELLEKDYFHAIFEATKSIAEKLRAKTGLTTDGGILVDQALGFKGSQLPLLAFNALESESERSEHRGLMNLIKGVFGAFRNTSAHAPRIHWKITQQDALDILTTISLIHRRLDSAVRTGVL